jgi:hypothetical protein
MGIISTQVFVNDVVLQEWFVYSEANAMAEQRLGIEAANWINLSNAVTATGATLNTTDSVTNGPQRFYRLMLSP